MPKDTNGVHFFNPAADNSDEETTAASPSSDVSLLKIDAVKTLKFLGCPSKSTR